MTSSGTLQRLSEPVRTRLRSTHILTSLPQVVSQLVQNALDASASHIDIGVDCQEWECWVKDDGNGITRSGLDSISKSYEAGRYSTSLLHQSRTRSRFTSEPDTSKAHTLGSLGEICTFGFRGEGNKHILCPHTRFVTGCVALASAADVSCLEISSRTAISRQTWSIITKVHTSLLSSVIFLKPGRTVTVSTTDPPHVGEWSIRGRLYVFVTYFTT